LTRPKKEARFARKRNKRRFRGDEGRKKKKEGKDGRFPGGGSCRFVKGGEGKRGPRKKKGRLDRKTAFLFSKRRVFLLHRGKKGSKEEKPTTQLPALAIIQEERGNSFEKGLGIEETPLEKWCTVFPWAKDLGEGKGARGVSRSKGKEGVEKRKRSSKGKQRVRSQGLHYFQGTQGATTAEQGGKGR